MYLEKIDNDLWLAKLAAALGMKLTAAQGKAVRLLAAQCDENFITDPRQVAYILATCYHECRFKSIREIRAKHGSPVWKMQNRYWATGYYGRGFSQLTWERNYRKFSPIVGVDLVRSPDEALKPEIGAKILVVGMKGGLFSGVGLDRYFRPGGGAFWLAARKIVNGTFQADKVAAAAKKILPLLLK